MSRAAGSVEPPSAGLLVTQNGKVIYRLPPEEPRAATGTSGTTEASENVSATRLIHRVDPQYPPDASARHIQGLVALDIQIGADGAVHNIAVVEGDPVLAGAAVQAVRQWRYQPYSVDGRPVEMQTRITIRFTLPPS
jgi:protein TonB